MKIIVCIKQAPDTTEVKLDPIKGTLIRDDVLSIMNPDDKGALERALLPKDQFGAEMSIITVGSPQATTILREAFAMGCDKGYLIINHRFGGADTLTTSYTISQALKTTDYDIILVGRQAIDGDIAQVGPQIAEQPDLPQITYVEHVDCDGEKALTVMRNAKEGYKTLEIDTPCMLAFLTSAYELRYMNIPDIMTVFNKEITTLVANGFPAEKERLGLKGSPTRVRKFSIRDVKAMGTLYEGMTPEEAADLIIEKLKEEFIV